MTSCCAILGNTAVKNDNKILLWVLGVIPPLLEMVEQDFTRFEEILDVEGEDAVEDFSFRRAEYALYVLW